MRFDGSYSHLQALTAADPAMSFMHLLASLALCLVAGLAPPALAQWNPGATAYFGQLMGQTNLMVGNLAFGRAVFDSEVHQPQSQKTRVNLSFIASPAVAAEFKSNLITNMIKSDPRQEAEIRSELARVDVDDVFAKALRGQGLSPTNLADIIATNSAISWKIVNDAPDPSPAALHAISKRIAVNLAANPTVARASDRDKQLFAESLAYQTVFAASSATSAQAAGNAAALASLRQNLIDRFRGMNVNLTAVRLTDKGFVPK